MKKIFIVIIIILLTGCGNDKTIKCKISFENKELNYIMNATYKIYSKKGFVTKIVKEEKYESNSRDTIKYLVESKKIEYSNLNGNYGGYTYNISKGKNKLELNSTIILKEVNLNKMVEDKYISSYYVKKNKLSLGGIKEFYKSRGAICE